MKYLLSIYTDESGFRDVTPEQAANMTAAYSALSREMEAAGVALGGEGLQPTSTATTVRVRDGERLLTDGPFAETREQLGGFYVVEAASLDEAIDLAAKIPGASTGVVEVRPVQAYDESGNPVDDAAQAAS